MQTGDPARGADGPRCGRGRSAPPLRSGNARRGPLRRRVVFASVIVAALGAAVGGAAQDRGAYFSVDFGGATARALGVAVSGVDHPTRCDALLYPDPAAAPRDEACTAVTPREFFRNLFDPGRGFTGGGALGYRFGRLRVEVSLAAAGSEGHEQPVAFDSGDDPALAAKTGEWDPDDPPSERLSPVRIRQGFANAILDLANPSPITPYVGVGVGYGEVRTRYRLRARRRADLGPAAWQRAAAGATSSLDTDLEARRVGVRAFAGLGLELGARTVLDVKAHWVRFSGFTAAGRLWERVRGHEPVRADGTTPFTSDIALGDLARFGVTVGMRYGF